MLKDIFSEFNDIAFNGELPEPEIRVIHSKDFNVFGLFDTTDFSITINTFYTESDQIIGTMLHEMIHLWQYFTGDKGAWHGKRFRRKVRQVSKLTGFRYDSIF